MNEVTLISLLICNFSVLLFIYRNLVDLGYLPFADESGHFLGAIAIQNGDILYRDYIDAHGSLIFILTWLFGKCIGFTQVWVFRLLSSIFVTVAGFFIFKCSIHDEL